MKNSIQVLINFHSVLADSFYMLGYNTARFLYGLPFIRLDRVKVLSGVWCFMPQLRLFRSRGVRGSTGVPTENHKP